MSIPRKASSKSHETSALIAGIAAFTTWGLVPIYWKLLKAVPATEILAHRFVWTSIFLIALLTWQHRWTEVETNVRSQRASLYCLASGSMIAITWFLYIWAIIIGRVIETSLGYVMTPLINVLLGAVFLRERLRRWQFVSVLTGSIGVFNLIFGYGRFPWVRCHCARHLDFMDCFEKNPARRQFLVCLSKRFCSFRWRSPISSS